MHGFHCAEFSKPVYFGLRTLKREILQGATGRDALSVALAAASCVYRQPDGPEPLKRFYDDLRTVAPSETLPLFTPEPELTVAVELPREQVVQMAGR